MFRYSLVYALRDPHHPLCDRLSLCASSLGLFAPYPHVTIRHGLDFSTALGLHEVFKRQYKLPDIRVLPSVSVSSTLLFNANGKRVSFYSLEQPVLVNNRRIPGLHLSVAYKLSQPFTVSEMSSIRALDETLEASNWCLSVHSCHAKSPRFWRKIL